MIEAEQTARNNVIPVKLSEEQFNEFILKRLPVSKRGPAVKIPRQRVFNYILHFLYTGCQWKEIPISLNDKGKREIHPSTIFKIYKKWLKFGTFMNIFEDSVMLLHKEGLLDLSILHGDGTTTAAKKVGDCIGYSGHKKNEGRENRRLRG